MRNSVSFHQRKGKITYTSHATVLTVQNWRIKMKNWYRVTITNGESQRWIRKVFCKEGEAAAMAYRQINGPTGDKNRVIIERQ